MGQHFPKLVDIMSSHNSVSYTHFFIQFYILANNCQTIKMCTFVGKIWPFLLKGRELWWGRAGTFESHWFYGSFKSLLLNLTRFQKPLWENVKVCPKMSRFEFFDSFWPKCNIPKYWLTFEELWPILGNFEPQATFKACWRKFGTINCFSWFVHMQL